MFDRCHLDPQACNPHTTMAINNGNVIEWFFTCHIIKTLTWLFHPICAMAGLQLLSKGVSETVVLFYLGTTTEELGWIRKI